MMTTIDHHARAHTRLRLVVRCDHHMSTMRAHSLAHTRTHSPTARGASWCHVMTTHLPKARGGPWPPGVSPMGPRDLRTHPPVVPMTIYTLPRPHTHSSRAPRPPTTQNRGAADTNTVGVRGVDGINID